MDEEEQWVKLCYSVNCFSNNEGKESQKISFRYVFCEDQELLSLQIFLTYLQNKPKMYDLRLLLADYPVQAPNASEQ